MLPRTASGDYRVYNYEKFDWSTQADPKAEREVHIQIDYRESVNEPQFFYVALASSGYTGISELVANKAPIKVISSTGAAVVVEPSALSVVEGASNAYSVRLATRPSGDVTVTITGHVGTDVTLSDESLVFTPDDWDTAREVTVTAGADADETSEQVVLALSATGGGYDTAAVDDVTVTVVDVPEGQAVVQLGASPPPPLLVSEGNSDTYMVVLSESPLSGDVTVTISGHVGTDVTLSSESLVFTLGNWDIAQEVTVTVLADDDAFDESVVLVHVGGRRRLRHRGRRARGHRRR